MIDGYMIGGLIISVKVIGGCTNGDLTFGVW